MGLIPVMDNALRPRLIAGGAGSIKNRPGRDWQILFPQLSSYRCSLCGLLSLCLLYIAGLRGAALASPNCLLFELV